MCPCFRTRLVRHPTRRCTRPQLRLLCPSAHPCAPLRPSAHLCTPLHPSGHPCTPLCPLYAPLRPSAHPAADPSVHPSTPLRSSAHPCTPASLCAPLCPSLCSSTPLCTPAPLCAPMRRPRGIGPAPRSPAQSKAEPSAHREELGQDRAPSCRLVLTRRLREKT